MVNNGLEVDECDRKKEMWMRLKPFYSPPGCYQRLEFYIQVLRVLCPNLTDASSVDE